MCDELLFRCFNHVVVFSILYIAYPICLWFPFTVPPSALQLQALSSTSHSITLQFGPSKATSSSNYDDGGAPLRRLVLTWRRQGGEWREVELGRTIKEYTLTNLDCGTSHHLYITPYNAIGE